MQRTSRLYQSTTRDPIGPENEGETVIRRTSVRLAVGVAIALLAAGCGDSSASKGTSSSPPTTSSASASGASTTAQATTVPAGNKATGAPVTIGWVNVDNSPSGSFPEMTKGVQTALSYVNNELGGWNGHPIKLDTCNPDSSAGASTNCSNQLVADHVPLVLTGVDAGSGGGVPVLLAANIPNVTSVPLGAAALTSANVFALAGGGVANIPAIANYITGTLHAKKVVALVTDNPSALGSVNSFAGPVYKAAGTDFQVIAVPAATADFGPIWAQAASGKPDFIMAVFGSDACLKLMQSRQSIGITIPTAYTESCASDTILKSAASSADNAYFTGTTLLTKDPNDADVATYVRASKQYSPADSLGGYHQLGFAQIMNTYAVLKTITGPDLTPAAVTSAFKGAVKVPGFMTHSFTCDGTVNSTFKPICNASVRILQQKNGVLTDVLNAWIPAG